MKSKINLATVLGVLILSFLSKTTLCQDVEMVVTKVVPAYEGKSYRALKSVTLTDGFSFTATSNSSFFITIDDYQTAPILNQVQSYNKITTEVVKIPGITTDLQLNNLSNAQKKTTVSYWDGLRREIQTIDHKGSPTGNDMVQPIAYDKYGKQSTQYLPYVSGNANGSFSSNAIADQAAFYNTGDKIAVDSKPYIQNKYDDSPLDIVVEQGGVGADLQPGTGHTVKSVYRVNTTADQVIRWTVAGPGVNFNEQELSVTELTDQNGDKTLTFTDKSGKLLLKKVYLDEDIAEAGSTQHADYLETYYVYDDLGNLVYQISPKATAKIKNGAVWNAAFIEEWVFKYSYDEKARLIEKKVPGSGSTYVVYDQLDRPVLTQDAKMRAANKWTFTKYDLRQRPVEQGIYSYSELFSGSSLTPREQLQKYYNELNYDIPGTYYHEKREGGTVHGYSNQAFPNANITVMTVNYYDDYDFNYDASPDYSYVNPGLSGAAAEAHMQIQGQLTGTKKLMLGTSTWLTSVVFYDQYGRAIEKRSNNQLYNSGLNDIQALVYEGFSALPKLAKQVKVSSASANITVNTRYEYDHRDRLKQVYQSNNGSGEQLIAQYAYNELGQLIDKSLHAKSAGGFLQSLDYRYTIQGWLSRINNSSLTAEADDNGTNDIFGMEFAYNTAVSGLTSASNFRFDGKVSAVKWKTNDLHSTSSTPVYERSYRFDYDKTGRLKNANYAAFNGSNWSTEAGGYDERDIRYDHNGNFLGLKRYSINIGSSSAVLIDDLTYTYFAGAGNQLKQVEDASGNSQGFKESAHVADEYGYDDNGNLVSDKNKGDGTTAMAISYNELNKTSRVDLPGGKYILYTYAATGERLRKETHDNANVKITDYIEGFVFENSTLAYFPMAEGRVRNAAGTLKYEYYITDQQGNVRLSFEEGINGEAQIVQENHFYPFGLAMKGAIIRTALPSTADKHFYNGGSELQDDFGDDPNVYSTFFREYDPVLGRMNAVDPMADKYADLTPYNYSFNSPISINDPSGGDPSTDMYGAARFDENGLYIPRHLRPRSESDYDFNLSTYSRGSGIISDGSGTGGGYTYQSLVKAVNSIGSLPNGRYSILNDGSIGLPEVFVVGRLGHGKMIVPDWWGNSQLFLGESTGNQGGDPSGLKDLIAIAAGESAGNRLAARAITSTMLNRLDAAGSNLNDPNWMAASIHSKGLGGTVKGNYQILRHPNQYEYKMVMDMSMSKIRKSSLPYIVGALQAYDNRGTMDYSNGAISWSATPLTPQARAKDSNFQRVSSGIFKITIVAGNSTFFGFR